MSAQDKTASSRRGQAITGAVAGVAVILVLVAVFVGIQLSDDDEPTAAPTPAATQPAEQTPAEPAPSQAAPAQAAPDPALLKPPVVEAGKGDVKELKVTTLVEGKGPKLVAGQTVTVNYVGVTYTDGKEFDSSWKNGQPVQFPVGVGQLIKGWDEGLVGVPVGSRVMLDIPAEKAYGEQAEGGRPSGDLRFVIDILAAQ
ncbi:FKBP-type peptidyl-prolyl cis-trans isomerase [Actinoplanes sp. NPDC049118]|uniref:FKBP-type peptidyl-prolyl cis-trans isomerase n=1 Tax=Actinoplanes sp. NPDC049118 TaxID=3155769 RepID=UPI0033F5D207